MRRRQPQGDFPLPHEWRVTKTQADIPPCVDRVTAAAGDAIIFTEACIHGYGAVGRRRRAANGFLQILPACVAWGPCYYNADHYANLTENQRAILTPPSAFGPSSHTTAIWQKAQAEQAELARLRKELAELKGRA